MWLRTIENNEGRFCRATFNVLDGYGLLNEPVSAGRSTGVDEGGAKVCPAIIGEISVKRRRKKTDPETQGLFWSILIGLLTTHLSLSQLHPRVGTLNPRHPLTPDAEQSLLGWFFLSYRNQRVILFY